MIHVPVDPHIIEHDGFHCLDTFEFQMHNFNSISTLTNWILERLRTQFYYNRSHCLLSALFLSHVLSQLLDSAQRLINSFPLDAYEHTWLKRASAITCVLSHSKADVKLEANGHMLAKTHMFEVKCPKSGICAAKIKLIAQSAETQ